MRYLSLFVVAISTLAMVLGISFLGLGIWGLVSSTGSLVLSMEPGWHTNDYVMWGFVLTIVGYLGLLRARSEAGGKGLNNG